MPKTGTTALQSALSELRPMLRRAGVLYPEPFLGSHNILGIANRPFEDAPKQYRQIYDADHGRLYGDLNDWWDAVAISVRTEKPEVLLLSGEAMFSKACVGGVEKLLGEVSDYVTVVAYVRRPSASFLSEAQQRVRASKHIGPFETMYYRPVLESYGEVWRCVAVGYDTGALMNGDIVLDFFSRFLPTFEIDTHYAPRRVNVGLSAEAMCLLQNFKTLAEPSKELVYTAETHYVIAAIRAVSSYWPQSRATLKPELADQIDYADPELLWLRETHGVTFEGLDYEKIGKDAALPGVPAGARVEDVCEVDPAVRDRLVMLVMCNLAARCAQQASGHPQGAIR